MVLPDYRGGSIVNLMASIGAARGLAPGPYPPLRDLPPAALAGAQNLVLLILDGLGWRWLEAQGRGGALHARLRGRLTSVFPSTTATAIPAFFTGLAPQQHGLVGWFTHCSEAGGAVAVLPFRSRAGGAALAQSGITPARLFSGTPLADLLPDACFVVSPKDIVDSEFNAHHAGRAQRRGYGDGAAGLFREIGAVVRSGPGRKYIHAYYPELDSLVHVFGSGSREVTAAFERLDRLFGEFLRAVSGSGTLVVATADHGFVDVPPQRSLELDDHPGLAATLAQPLSGERRVVYCHVRPGRAAEFEAYCRGPLAPCCDCHPSARLLEQGWFGLGPPHPRLAQRIGDYTLVMKENYALKDWLPGEKRYRHIGHHGGVSADEMLVPLILAAA